MKQENLGIKDLPFLTFVEPQFIPPVHGHKIPKPPAESGVSKCQRDRIWDRSKAPHTDVLAHEQRHKQLCSCT